jgi:hypothetical protein
VEDTEFPGATLDLSLPNAKVFNYELLGLEKTPKEMENLFLIYAKHYKD